MNGVCVDQSESLNEAGSVPPIKWDARWAGLRCAGALFSETGVKFELRYSAAHCTGLTSSTRAGHNTTKLSFLTAELKSKSVFLKGLLYSLENFFCCSVRVLELFYSPFFTMETFPSLALWAEERDGEIQGLSSTGSLCN